MLPFFVAVTLAFFPIYPIELICVKELSRTMMRAKFSRDTGRGTLPREAEAIFQKRKLAGVRGAAENTFAFAPRRARNPARRLLGQFLRRH